MQSVSTKPKRHSKPKPVEDVLFNRDKGRVPPVRVRNAAELWLDLFTSIYEVTCQEHEPLHARKKWLEDSAELADHGLELYEQRWPHMAHGD